MKNEFQTISAVTKKLLAKSEGFDVDFKKNSSGVKPEDFVAFANSKDGGNILIGVEETQDSNGKQCGKPFGCNIGDKEKLKLIQMARSCVPPIDINIYIENLSSKQPFLRIKIGTGPNKPYCTDRGLYMTRGDARKIPLHPMQLLELYLQSESTAFADKFKIASEGIVAQLQAFRTLAINQMEVLGKEFQDRLDYLENITPKIEDLENTIEESTKNIESNSEESHFMVEEIWNSIGDLLYETESLQNFIHHSSYENEKTELRFLKIFEVLKVDDPYLAKRIKSAKNFIQTHAKLNIKNIDKINHHSLLNDLNEAFPNIKDKVTISDIEKWTNEVLIKPNSSK